MTYRMFVSLLLATHFVADFLLQTDRMALNKGRWWKALTPPRNFEGLKALVTHAAVYAACFFWLGTPFLLVTFLTHFITDALTSQMTSKYWFFTPEVNGLWRAKTDSSRHWFFVWIGFDQLIHGVTLLWTLKLLS